MLRMRGSRPATTRGVNAWLTSLRSFVCRGGSSWVRLPAENSSASGISRAVCEE